MFKKPKKDDAAVTEQLFRAKKVCDLEGIEKDLRKGRMLPAADGSEQSFLCFLILAGKPRHLLSWVIEHNADVNWQQPGTGDALMHIACGMQVRSNAPPNGPMRH